MVILVWLLGYLHTRIQSVLNKQCEVHFLIDSVLDYVGVCELHYQ